MPMRDNGLAKLVEECGEVLQVAGKLQQYPELQHEDDIAHPDGTKLRERLKEEMADVLAAIEFVTQKLGLDKYDIFDRAQAKTKLFKQWDKEP